MKPDTSPLTAREVYQVLKDVALGLRILHRASTQSSRTTLSVDVDGWQLRFFLHDDALDHCDACQSPDARVASIDDWQRYGTGPVDLLSAWERAQLERLLKAL